jgi:hypothetical protein
MYNTEESFVILYYNNNNNNNDNNNDDDDDNNNNNNNNEGLKMWPGWERQGMHIYVWRRNLLATREANRHMGW